MELSLPSQSGLTSPDGAIVRNHAVREYEQIIQDLRNENFDLKMRIYLYEKKFGKSDDLGTREYEVMVNNADCGVSHEDSPVNRDFLAGALQQTAQLKELQEQLENEHALLVAEQEKCSKLENEAQEMKTFIFQKDKEFQEAHEKITSMETLSMKKSSAIQGLMKKYCRLKENVPDEIRPIVESAVQAAKDSDENCLQAAMNELKEALHQICDTGRTSTNQVSQEESFSANDFLENLQGHGGGSSDTISRSVDIENEQLKEKISALETEIRELHENELQKNKNESTVSTRDSIEQTEIQWRLLQTADSDELLKNTTQLQNVEEPHKNILLLLKLIEDKDNEISSIQQKLSDAKANSAESFVSRHLEDFINERDELHEKLTVSTNMNNALMMQLKNLAIFMEDLLHRKDKNGSIINNISDSADFFDQLSIALNLSEQLSNQLSNCENSVIFTGDESSVYNKDPFLEQSSYSHESIPKSSEAQFEGMNRFASLYMHKSSTRAGKRRLYFTNNDPLQDYNSTLLKTMPNEDCIFIDPDVIEVACNSLKEGGKHLKSTRCYGHFTSDSDIWSEPDRDISMQRIGINVQKTPQKSPRRHRTKWSSSTEGSPKYDSCSSPSKSISWSKRRRNTESSRAFVCKRCNQLDNSPNSEGNSVQELSRINDLQNNKINELSVELSNLQKESSTNVIKLNQQIQQLGEEKQTQERLNSELRIKLTDSDNLREKLTYELNNVKQQLSEMYQKCVDNEMKLKLAQSQLASDRNYLTESLAKEQEENKKYHENIMELQQKYLQSQLKLNQNVESINVLEKTKADLQSDIQKLEQKELSSKQMLKELQLDLQSTRKKLRDMDAKCASHEEDLQRTLKEKQHITDALSSLRDLFKMNLDAANNFCKLKFNSDENMSMGDTLDILSSKVSALNDEGAQSIFKMIICDDDRFKAVLSNLAGQLQSLIQDQEKKGKEIQDLNMRIKQMQQFNQELQQNEREKHKIESEYSREVKSVYQQLEQKSAEIKSLQMEINGLKREIQHKDYELKKSKETERRSSLESNASGTLAMQQQQLNTKVSEIQVLKKSVEQLQMHVDELNMTIDKQSSVNEENEQKLFSLREEIAKKDIELDSLRSTSDDKYQSHISELKTQLDDAKGEIQSLKNSKQSQSSTESESDEHIQPSTSLISDSAEIGENTSKSFEENESRVSQLQQQLSTTLSESKNQNSELEGYIKNCRDYIDQLEEQKKSDDKEINTLYSVIEEKDSENKSLKEEIGKMQVSVIDKSSIEELKAKYLSSQEEIQVQELQLSGLKDEKEFLNSTLNRLKQKLKEYDDENNRLNERLSSSQNEIERYQQLLDSKQEEIMKLHNRVFELQSEINSFMSANHNRDTNSKTQSGDNVIFKGITASASAPVVKDTQHSKRCKELEAKLSMARQRIEILEKEKSDMRDQLREVSNVSTVSSEQGIVLEKKVTDLESTVENKSAIIKELKKEIQKRWNETLSKQAEVDELQKQLSKASQSQKANRMHSNSVCSDDEMIIQNLKKHKWDLIQTISDLLLEFCEVKGMSPDQFEVLQKNIKIVHCLQATSLPLKSTQLSDNSRDLSIQRSINNAKNLKTELCLDVEYFRHFRDFLKTCIIPIAHRTCQHSTSSHKNIEASASSQKKLPPDEMLPSSENRRSSEGIEIEVPANMPTDSRLILFVLKVLGKLDSMERALGSLVSDFHHFDYAEHKMNGHRKHPIKSLVHGISQEIGNLQANFGHVIELGKSLKSIEFIAEALHKRDLSDRDSNLSGETLSRSLSPFDERLIAAKSTASISKPMKSALSKSQDSIFQRSLHTSPDLGIESDPNRESSAPEQSRNATFPLDEKYSKLKSDSNKIKTFNGTTNSKSDTISAFDLCQHAMGKLKHYELLKKELQECLVGIKSILTRTGDGMHRIGTQNSPRKNLEYGTLKAVKDSGYNIQVCLEEAYDIINKFWIGPCPSAEKLNKLLVKHEEQQEELKKIVELKQEQEVFYEDILDKLKKAEKQKEYMEHELQKKLLKTKKVIKKMEMKLLQSPSKLPKGPVI